MYEWAKIKFRQIPKSFRDVPSKRDVQVTGAGKAFRANTLKVLASNRTLGEYFMPV